MKTKLFIGVAITALAAVVAKKVDLKLNLEEGKEYVQITTVESLTKQTMMGQTQEINQMVEATTKMKVIEKGNGTDTYEISYGSISMSMEGMGQKQTFTSDTTSLEMVDPMSKIFAGLTDKMFTAKITEKGKVQEVSGLEEMVTEAIKEMPGGEAMQEQIMGSFGDNGLTKTLETTTDIFPDKAVKPGDEWTKTQYTSTGFPLIATTTYKLKSLENGVAVIEVSAKLETDSENATTEIQGLEATMYYDGTRTGMLNMDAATGWVTSGTLKDEIVGSISIAPNAQIPDGMTIPVEMVNTMTISN